MADDRAFMTQATAGGSLQSQKNPFGEELGPSSRLFRHARFMSATAVLRKTRHDLQRSQWTYIQRIRSEPCLDNVLIM